MVPVRTGFSCGILVLKLLRGKRSAWGVLKTVLYCNVSIIGRMPMTGAGSASIRIICVTVLISSIRGIGLCLRCICIMGLSVPCIRINVEVICIVVGLVGRFCSIA